MVRAMTYPSPPQPMHPPAAPPAGTDRGRGGMGKVLLVALLIGAVVAVLAGTGAFFGSRSLTGGDGAVRCGDSDLCFANFDVDGVTGYLTGHGFTCHTSRECQLWTGSGRYEAALSREGDRLRRYEAIVSYAPGVAMPPRGEDFLAWFAALPFGADTTAASGAQQWLAANRHAGGDHSVRTEIGGYEFRLVHRERADMWVSLMVEAGEPWL